MKLSESGDNKKKGERDGYEHQFMNAPLAAAAIVALAWAADELAGGRREAGPVLAEARRRILAAGFASLDYVELRDAETLAPLERAAGPARLLAAAWLGKARLIDNVPVLCQ